MNWTDHERKWKHCKRCPLHKGRKKVVLGMGDLEVPFMFFGQYPGQDEDKTGLPVQGVASKWTWRAIRDAAGIHPNQCFMANVLGCYNGGVSVSKKDLEPCARRVFELVGIVKPKLIIPMGLVATRFFKDDFKISMASAAATKGTWNTFPLFFTTPPFEPARAETVTAAEISKKKITKEFKALRRYCIELGLLHREIE